MKFEKRSLDLLKNLSKSLTKSGEEALSYTFETLKHEAQDLLQKNYGGAEVSWSGGQFRVNVGSGALRSGARAIYPHQGDPNSMLLTNEAPYAEEIEHGIRGETKKRRLLAGGKVSKAGRRYRVIPLDTSNPMAFFTVTEDSIMRDQQPRPVMAATMEALKPRIIDLVEAHMKASIFRF